MPNRTRLCSCSSRDLTRRQFRKHMFMHDTAGRIIITLRSSSPGHWDILREDAVGSSKVSFRSAVTLTDTYHRCSATWRNLEISAGDKSLAEKYAPFLKWNISQMTVIGGGIAPATPAAVVPVTAATNSTIHKVNSLEELEEILSGTPAKSDEAAPAKKYIARAKTVGNGGSFVPPTINPKHYFYNSERDARYMKDFIALRRAGFITNLMIVGPSGFGKTDSIVHLADELGLPLYTMNCQVVTTPERWIGGMQVDATRGTYFEMSEHLKHVEAVEPGYEPGILLYDEVSRLRPDLLNMQFSLWDFQQGLEVPQLGRTVKMHPQNIVIATANMGAAYVGTFGLDRALRERFSSTLERGMPPADEEVKVLVSAVGVDKTAAEIMVEIANMSRDNWKSGNIDAPISTRTLITWAAYVAGGYEIKDAAEYTVVPQYPEDGGNESERAKVRQIISTKVKE